jgi:myosin-6
MAMQRGSDVWAWTGFDTAFERGKVDRIEAHKGVIHVKLDKGGKMFECKDDTVHLANHQNQDGVADNTELRQLNEATLLHNIRSRYTKDEAGCYTVTGHILIAVNPFKQLTIYDEKQIKRYLSRPIGSEPPHIYAIADRMYRLLVTSGENQAIIVSGPSGAGKTETCKLVLRHLAYVTKDSQATGASKSSMELGELLVRTNPVLEAFGNAETTLNKNSSRFGKFTQIHVSRNGAILGASIQHYLLESTRVVMHAVNECTYHINYQLVTGASSGDRTKHFIDQDPNKYIYMRSSSGKATPRRGADQKDFKEVCDVFKSIGVKEDMQSALYGTLSGVLHLGNIQLAEGANSETAITNGAELKTTSQLLGTHEALLRQGLTSRTMKLKGSEMQIPLKPEEARASRDALAKAIYGKLFGWVVQQVNNSLMDTGNKQDSGYLGILDIYGFENFERNSLEQLFINFANEQLHQHFAISLFKTEMEIYAREGIVCPVIEWEDNTECLEMIAGKSPNSIFNALAEHSRLPKSNDEGMTEKLLADNRKNKFIFPPKLTSGSGGKGQRLTHKEAFVVTHFAGDVVYRTEGWLRKNTDTLHEDLQVCMSSSTSPILSKLFSVGTINAITGGARGGGKRAGYVAEKYARQLEELMRTLRASHSHFVRCIKPNHQQEPHRFVNDLVLSQLRNSGMVDAVRLLSAGYSTRLPFETLEKQFKPLAPAKFQKLPANLFCVALLSAFDLGRADFLLGLTKAFFKSGKLAFVDSLMSGQKKLDAAFFAKMARLLALWRFRRGVSAVRCLIYLNAKMRRLRALWKFRRSASIASMIGSSWVRRTKEIRFGAAIERLQACGRGYLARRQRRKATEALLLLQRMGRGHTARVKRDHAHRAREGAQGARQGGSRAQDPRAAGGDGGQGGGGEGRGGLRRRGAAREAQGGQRQDLWAGRQAH